MNKKKYDKKIQKYHDKAKKTLPYSLNMFSYYELKAIFYEMLIENNNYSNLPIEEIERLLINLKKILNKLENE